ncbi:PQ-loop-domain-containing protein [Piedraia hortae CBS 480.64]|uniref:PQ-loop-domain-containing protein n=1 Tax=Piedraia hortae CBS 480.64 TaxID=1314780 RepID=A0A6A7BZJ4_9PEZI|nr:PQ-loop-domain-containing protein [Piedraia hortae CBS 480.64]
MFPPTAGYTLSISALSGICGSISIACWIVVFSPQIVENFRRSSAEGLSVEFIIIWLLGDVFNIVGAVLQNVIPTMVILAVYYTLADIVLLAQCFYYRGFSLRDGKPAGSTDTSGDITSNSQINGSGNGSGSGTANGDARVSPPANASDASDEVTASANESTPLLPPATPPSLNAAHLSPAIPIHPSPTVSSMPPTQKVLFNTLALLLVILSGVAGYILTPHPTHVPQAEKLTFNLYGQISGYICAVLYLGSRIPQLLLNYRRKSTEGLNALFFIFACLGNLTFVGSILAFEPDCQLGHHGRGGRHGHCRKGEAASLYGRYLLVNLSWLIGSLGTFFLDFAVFIQFWFYRGRQHTNRNTV